MQQPQPERAFGPEQIVEMNEGLLESAITLYLKKDYDKRLLPIKAKHHRDWWEVDSKTRMHARFCLPLTMASGLGFYILSPATFTVQWDGNETHDVEIEILDACSHTVIDNHSSFGSFTVQSSFIARTKNIGDFVYVKGIANLAQPYSVLEAMIESWWSPSEFGIVCLLNQAGKFKIKKGDPLAQMFVINSKHGAYDIGFTDGYPPIWPDWIVKQAPGEKNLDYFRGNLPNGTAVCPHFKSWSAAVNLAENESGLGIDDLIDTALEAQSSESYEEAQRQFERAVHLAEAQNQVDEYLIDSLHKFAMDRISDFKHELGFKLLFKCVALNETHFDAKLPLTADLYSDLAYAYSLMNNAAAASTQYENALRVKKETNEDALQVATTLIDFGVHCNHTGDLDRAAELFAEADVLLNKELPPEHRRRLFLKNATAILLTNQERFEEAAKLYEELLETRSEQHGECSIEVASTLNDFAFHYKLRKDLDKAERLFKKCIDIRVRELGENHLHVADAYEHVHWIYKDSKRTQDAVVALEHALKIRKALLPANDQAIKNNYELLAHLYFELGQNELAQNALLNARK